jgi:hypothetical protein
MTMTERRYLPVLDGAPPHTRRHHAPKVRARTENMNRYSKRKLEYWRVRRLEMAESDDFGDVHPPTTYGDCQALGLGTKENPCPWARCKHNLAIDVNPENGSITTRFPDKDIDELDATCAIRQAEEGPLHLWRVGELMNITRERVRQIEAVALKKAARNNAALREILLDFLEEDHTCAASATVAAIRAKRGVK